jgi:hypothetical protein
MSATNEPEPAGPRDPTHYAPRRLREEPEQRLAAADDIHHRAVLRHHDARGAATG